MSAPKTYGLILGLSIAAAAGVETASSTGRQSAAVAANETWTIPGAGRTPGQNNTFFVSDLALTNVGDAAANVAIAFVGPGGLPPKPITIAAGATTVYRDIVNALWSASGLVGALSVESDQPLVLRARTYNTAATGTFGVALPVFASDRLFAEGENADSIWVQQSPSGTSGFRTNVGVVFPDGDGGDALVTFYDAAGAAVGSLSYSSASAGFQQLPASSVAPAGLAVGRAQISVTRGRAAGYAVGVDNVTGDTSLYPFESLPAGVQDVVVSGVARLPGRNNTFFRTDARFYNPTPDESTVTVQFLAAGASNPTPQSATITVPAGRVVETVDVLGSILNAPVGSGGAVRFTSEQAIAILARTSNIDPQGVQPGTFGAQQRAVPLASFLSSADAGAVVTGIRQDASFRTNIGFAAGPDGAAYRLSLKNSQGVTIATTTGTLGGFGWAQPSVADLFSGTTVPAEATLLVEVTSGTIDVYDASLDNSSGDLVVTPIAPVRVDIPSSASIGPAGGSIQSDDGRLTLKVPAGALAAATTLSISPVANTAPNAIGSAYALTPVGVAFARPAQAVFSYSTEDLDGTGEGALGLASQDGSGWFAILGGSLDPITRTLRVPVTSTSPGPAPAGGGLVPQRSTANGNLGPFGSVRLEPNRAIVPVRGTKRFDVIFVGPSSTSAAAATFVLLNPGGPAQNAVTSWLVVDTLATGAADLGRITPSSTRSATYTAPNCPLDWVTIVVRVELLGTATSTRTPARIKVVERDWQIVATYRSQSLCSLGFAWSLDYSRSHNGAFGLDDQARVIDYLAGLNRGQTTTPAWCPGFDSNPCSPLTLTGSPIGDLNLNDVEGRLIDSLQGFAFDLSVSAEVPGTGATVSFTCEGHPPFVYLIPHATPRVVSQQQFLVHRQPNGTFEETLDFVYPGWIESARIVLTPIKPAGCP